ncbi:MAG: class I SAM-dependent methyltransferase [Gemmataceae bacterium]|nr:class I SAM-dependent methyltransferase [Gemmataceae bacterium]
MTEPPSTSYDEVPYPSYPFPQTHPNRLATVAALFGLSPAPLEGCRILELGCASGGNLLPMAAAYPEWRLLGIDASRRQVAAGQAVILELGLPNVELRCDDIATLGNDLGPFDYILCHGVYSWVPRAVQDKILEICARCLAPEGVAYVSYNTYPGWHMRGIVRDMMCYHTAPFADPATRVAQARSLLDFLARSVPADGSPYGLLLKNELAFVQRRSDSYLFHEFLEADNSPLHFHQFVERAAAEGLQYLGEAEIRLMVAGNLPGEVENVLRALSGDLVRLQQYLDFLRNTGFRQSLLCHKHARLDGTRRPERLATLFVASPARPVSPAPDLRSGAAEEFRSDQGGLTTDRPIVKAAMVLLAENWPRPVRFDVLCREARSRLGGPPSPGAPAGPPDHQVLAASLLNGYLTTPLVELSCYPPRFQLAVSERPVASRLARLQAMTGIPVANMRHESVELGPADRQLLGLLDGTRDRPSLAAPRPDEAVDQTLRRLAGCALLVG